MTTKQDARDGNTDSDCIIPPHPYDKPKAAIDMDKASSFYPDIEGFLTYKAEFKDDSDFWVSLGIQTSFNSCCQLSISQWSNVNVQLQMLKDLNRITDDAITFIERHNLNRVR